MHVHKCTEDLVQRRLPQRAHDHGGLFAVSSGLLRLRGVVVPIGRGVGESVVPAVGVVRSSRCYRSARPSPSALISPVHSHASPKKFRSRIRPSRRQWFMKLGVVWRNI